LLKTLLNTWLSVSDVKSTEKMSLKIRARVLQIADASFRTAMMAEMV
jgi:hypothetical protein